MPLNRFSIKNFLSPKNDKVENEALSDSEPLLEHKNLGLNGSTVISPELQEQVNDCLRKSGRDLEDGKIILTRGLMSTVLSEDIKNKTGDYLDENGNLKQEDYLEKFNEMHELVINGGEKSGGGRGV